VVVASLAVTMMLVVFLEHLAFCPLFDDAFAAAPGAPGGFLLSDIIVLVDLVVVLVVASLDVMMMMVVVLARWVLFPCSLLLL
jgi:hypothetical protein